MAEEQHREAQQTSTDVRWEFLRNLDAMLERPLIGLSLVWLLLLVIEFTMGIGPVLLGLAYGIWAIFVLDALIEIIIAPDRLAHIRRRWFAIIALAIPALRPLAAFRALHLLRSVRAIRSVGLVRVFAGINRGMRTARDVAESRGIGYVVAITFVVIFAGAAGMFWLEGGVAGGYESYADAVWWTAMLMTTVGTDFFPETGEARVLAWALSIYGMALFGYITATFASYLVGKDRGERKARETESALLVHVTTLQAQLEELRQARSTEQRSRRAG